MASHAPLLLPHATVSGVSTLDELLSDCCSATIDGRECNWNVGRMRRDAEAGVYGSAVQISIKMLPPGRVADVIDQQKVDRFKIMPAVLSIPVLILAWPPMPFICDGNHRIAALSELGAETFRAFVVPWEAEERYRISVA